MTLDQLPCYRATGTRCGNCADCDTFTRDLICTCASSYKLPRTVLIRLSDKTKIHTCVKCGGRRSKRTRGMTLAESQWGYSDSY